MVIWDVLGPTETPIPRTQRTPPGMSRSYGPSQAGQGRPQPLLVLLAAVAVGQLAIAQPEKRRGQLEVCNQNK